MPNSKQPFIIEPYSHATLVSMMCESSETTPEAIADKIQLGYFREYFEGIQAKTIVLERGYVDHDYLEDYAGYYVKCFHRYRRTCIRLHFFRKSIDENEFSACLETGNYEKLTTPTESDGLPPYLGFIVIRPLPHYIIGRTCLVPYEFDGDRRKFPTVQKHSVSLFGMQLSVATVAFQEQDRVTAACATSALWSAFQVTGIRFQHKLPSPVEITRSATDQTPLRSRTFPNTDGLTLEQMAHAIRSVGLEPFHIYPETPFFLKSACRAYLKAGIPLLLLHELTESKGSTRQHLGFHAVTITGVSIPVSSNTVNAEQSTYTCDKIDKLYVHDDQVGPHARMQFRENEANWWLTTYWGNGIHDDVRANPVAILVPLYNKIRIPAKVIYQEAVNLDDILSAIGILGVEWDVFLTSIQDFKSSVLNCGNYGGSPPRDIVLRNLPRFMWRVTGKISGKPVFDLLFDATDIDSGRYLLDFSVSDPEIDQVLNALETEGPLASHIVGRAFQEFKNRLRVEN